MEEKYIDRFYEPHKTYYEIALEEIRVGYKQSHWMWFIFPQIKGLGRSRTSKYYEIENYDEAREFLEDPILGEHLREISRALLECGNDNAWEIFGEVDALKLRSSMTLFHTVCEMCEENRVFSEVLGKFFGGDLDQDTLDILERSF